MSLHKPLVQTVFIYPWETAFVRRTIVPLPRPVTATVRHFMVHSYLAGHLVRDLTPECSESYIIDDEHWIDADRQVTLDELYLSYREQILHNLKGDERRYAILFCGEKAANDLVRCFEPAIDGVRAIIFEPDPRYAGWVPLRIEYQRYSETCTKARFSLVPEEEILLLS